MMKNMNPNTCKHTPKSHDRSGLMNPDDLIEKLESTANFMRGMCFDPRLHYEIKNAIRERVSEIDSFVEEYMKGAVDE